MKYTANNKEIICDTLNDLKILNAIPIIDKDNDINSSVPLLLPFPTLLINHAGNKFNAACINIEIDNITFLSTFSNSIVVYFSRIVSFIIFGKASIPIPSKIPNIPSIM
ncbi:MAG: hypothetical protein IKE70_01220 [Bacilli bacterium]|nr:hypothetical protein [Bacilli bacterium]